MRSRRQQKAQFSLNFARSAQSAYQYGNVNRGEDVSGNSGIILGWSYWS
jgi:hypothetical protein